MVTKTKVDAKAKAKSKAAAKHALPFMDPDVRFEHKKQLMYQILGDGTPQGDEMLKALFDSAAASNGKALEDSKLKQLNELLDAMQQGPLRSAIFDRMLPGDRSLQRARLLTEDGGVAYSTVPDPKLIEKLRCGDTVLLDSQGRAVLDVDPEGDCGIGELAKLERRIGRDRVEVSIRDMEQHFYRASERLIEKLDSGEVAIGSRIIVHTRRRMAMDGVPLEDGMAHYRHLVREPVPEVDAERDIGNPPEFLDELAEHLCSELEAPELGRKYRTRRAQTRLLYGVSGTGKTLSVNAFWRKMYEAMSEHTGVSIEDLPNRVVKLRMPTVLSKWLGDSDKRLDRFFDEVEQLAAEKFVTPDGREVELPVLAIGEEIDGLARSRGEGDAIYDRIQTTALERLDTNCARLRNLLIVFLFTTNVPHLVDAAFLRRAGGSAERFGRLDRRSFGTVLAKHLRDLPLSKKMGEADQAQRQTVRQVTDWLYSPNGHDPGQVQVSYVGSTTPDVKYRRDFLTGALVDRATQQAAGQARRAERAGCADPGLTPELIIAACDDQIRTIVDQVTEFNLANYVTLPEGARVGTVRRIEQPRVSPFELARGA